MGVKSAIKKGLYKIGFYPPKKIKQPERVHKELRYAPYAVVHYVLKQLSDRIQENNDHRYYNQLLKEFVPEWNPPIEKAEFFGEGHGVDSFDVYRRVKTSCNTYFEKVYFTQAKDLKKTQWVLTNLVQKNILKLKTPQIKKIYTGPVLTIVYFEMFKLRKLSKQTLGNGLVQISKDLYKASVKEDREENSFPKYLRQYIPNNESNRKELGRIEKAKKRLSEHKIDVGQLEQLLQDSRITYAHGDISEQNVFKNNTVIDWDYFGRYPIGTDVSKIYIRLKRNGIMTESLEAWLKTNYSALISESDWEDFKRNTFYLIYIYNYTKYCEWSFFEELEQEIIKKLTK